jgi:hypothetical protein
MSALSLYRGESSSAIYIIVAHKNQYLRSRMAISLVTSNDLQRFGKEINLVSDVQLDEEATLWGVEPEALINLMEFFGNGAIRRLQSGADVQQVIGGVLYTGLAFGVKIAQEVEMRRIADSGT